MVAEPTQCSVGRVVAIRVALEIAPDLVRSGLCLLVASSADFRVVERLAKGPTPPADVFVIGVGSPDDLAAVRAAAGRHRVVALSPRGDEETAIAVLRAGALGFVSLDAHAREFLHAIREVAAGRVCLHASGVRSDVPEFLRIAEHASSVLDVLSRREREVLPLAARGMANGEIAAHLGIGVRTVETHRARLMRKIAARDQTELVRFAERAGILAGACDPGGGEPDGFSAISVRKRIFSKGQKRGSLPRKKYGS